MTARLNRAGVRFVRLVLGGAVRSAGDLYQYEPERALMEEMDRVLASPPECVKTTRAERVHEPGRSAAPTGREVDVQSVGERDGRPTPTPKVYTQTFRLDRDAGVQLSKALPSWGDTSVQAYQLNILMEAKDGEIGGFMPDLFRHYPGDGVKILSLFAVALRKALYRKEAYLKNLLASVGADELIGNMVAEEGLILSISLTREIDDESGGEWSVRVSVRNAFLDGLCSVFLSVRAALSACTAEAQATKEAHSLASFPRRAGSSDATYIREFYRTFESFRTLWGPKWYAKMASALQGMLVHLALSLEPEKRYALVQLANKLLIDFAASKQVPVAKLAGVPEQSLAYLKPFASLPGVITDPMIISQAHDLILLSVVGALNQTDLIAPFFAYMNKSMLNGENMLSHYDEKQGMERIAQLAQGDVFAHAPAVLAVVHERETLATVGDSSHDARQDTVDQVAAMLKEFSLKIEESNAALRKDVERKNAESRQELAHFGTLVKHQMENMAPPDYKHAPRSTTVEFVDEVETVAAVADNTKYEKSPGRSRGPPGRRPVARNADGSIKPRLMDKPPTLWSEIQPSMRQTLALFGIKDNQDWIKRENDVCKLCGPDANHYWSRCVRVWASTPGGERLLGASRAAEMIRAAQANVPSTVAAVAYLFDAQNAEPSCYECVAEGSGAQLLDEQDQAACMLNFIRAICADYERSTQ
jgi:hypothetical protein